MKRFLIVLILVTQASYGQDQLGRLLGGKSQYENAFEELKGMLEGKARLDFKRAVFITENAYLNGSEDYEEFCAIISFLSDKCVKMADQTDLSYNESDRENIRRSWAVYRLMTDSVKFYIDSSSYYTIAPFRYDFEDFWGERDWTKMFVTKLLDTHTGNCHSLPFLYKILCNEIGVKAHLAMAPNHIYIKQKSIKTGWYNTELTNGSFPIDAWIMASGYVHLNAVQNRIYMDTLSDRQSVAVCLIDLAKGYEKKFGALADLDFITRCIELALANYPQYVNGLIFQAETLKKRFEEYVMRHNAKYPSDVFYIPEAKELFERMEKLYYHIHRLGYRMMPKQMYIDWLADLNNEREKYQNKNVTNSFNTRN